MITRIRAPHPSHKVTMILPSPTFGDSRAATNSVTVKRSMLGRVITYVTSNAKELLSLPFEMTRLKALEVEAFFRVYYRAPLEIFTEYDGVTYVGTLATPLDRTGIGRHRADLNSEMVSMTLEFLVEKQ